MRKASVDTEQLCNFSWLAGIGLVLAFTAGSPVRGDEAEAEGRFVDVPVSLRDGEVKRLLHLVELELTRFKQSAKDAGPEKWKDFKIIFVFNPEGKTNSSDEHELCLMLANGIRKLEKQGASTTAFVQGEVSRHSVLPVLACRQIVMSAKAKIGPVLRADSPAPTEVEKASYRTIATRLNSPDLVEKLFDADIAIVPGKKGGWVDARKTNEAAGGRPLFESGAPAIFNFNKAREAGLCGQDARESPEDLRIAYRLSRRSLQQNPLIEKPITWRIPVVGEVNGALEEQLKRRLRKAVGHKANLVILELRCHDGNTDVANSLGEYLRTFNDDRSDRPVMIIAYVTEQAQNTALPIAMGCTSIVIDPKASLGGFGKLLRQRSDEDVKTIGEGLAALAEKKSYPRTLARAFVDRSVKSLFYVTSSKGDSETAFFTGKEKDEERNKRPGYWVEPGEEIPLDEDHLLTLKADAAVRFKMASSKGDLDSIYRDMGVKASDVRVSGSDWLDELADFLRNEWTQYILIMIGITCLILELKMPGVGLPGIIAAICFVLFFWSQSQLGGQVIWLAVLLFLLGLVLLAIEIFILPGFGVCGISGILLVIGSLGLVAYGHWPQDGTEWGALMRKLAPFGIVLMSSVVLAILLGKYLPSIPYVNRLLLKPQTEESDVGAQTPDPHRESMTALLGAIGVAATPLRPAGKVQFGEQYIDVVAEGSYIVPGTRVQVIEIEGNRIVVKAV
jgi:membrane-bound ClpP family serine protease